MGRPKLIGPHTAAETKRKQARERWYRENDELTKKRALEHKHRDHGFVQSNPKYVLIVVMMFMKI